MPPSPNAISGPKSGSAADADHYFNAADHHRLNDVAVDVGVGHQGILEHEDMGMMRNFRVT